MHRRQQRDQAAQAKRSHGVPSRRTSDGTQLELSGRVHEPEGTIHGGGLFTLRPRIRSCFTSRAGYAIVSVITNKKPILASCVAWQGPKSHAFFILLVLVPNH